MVAAVAMTLVTVPACTSAGAPASTTPVPTPARTTSQSPSDASSAALSHPAIRAPSTPVRTVSQLCTAATSDAALAGCVLSSLNGYWSGRLHRSVHGHVVLGLPRKLPGACRFPAQFRAIHARTAFECPADATIYLGPVLLRHLHQDRPAAGFGERLAAIMGHEEGHLVQDTVHQQQPDTVSPDAGSRFIEQQADCLSGAWAHGIGLRRDGYLRAAHAELADVDDPEHRRDHGTVGRRLAAVRRGLGGLSACRLAHG